MIALRRAVERIGTNQSLVKRIFVIAVGRLRAAHFCFMRPIESAPSPEMLFPLVGQLREDVNPRPRVLAALGVMSRGGVQRMGPARLARVVEFMKLIERDAELVRVAADVVERQQTVINVKRRVL